MIRFHMLDYYVVRLFVAQSLFDVAEPLVGHNSVGGVKHSRLFIHYNVGIVSHALRDLKLSLKKIDTITVCSDVIDIICNFGHYNYLKCIFLYCNTFRTYIICINCEFYKFWQDIFLLRFNKKGFVFTR